MDDDRRLRILFAPETFNLGETSRAVEVAKEVRRLGHEVRFMGYSTRFAEYVRDAGFTLELLDPELSEDQADQLIAVDQGRGIRHPFTAEVVRRRVASELALMEGWSPDCVVIGSTMTLFISARAASVPLVYIRPYAMSRGHLKQMSTFPLVTAGGRIGRSLNRIAAGAIRTCVPMVRWKPASFRRVAAEHQVALPTATIEAISADLNLIASLFPHLDDRLLAADEQSVGPIYARGEGELSKQVTSLATRGRPLVYVGLGSSAGRRLALDILDQIARLDIEVLTSAGRYLSEADRAALPGNVQVHDFLPAHRLAGLIDASIIHGGEGTVQTACASGVPFAGIGLQTEQRINLDECADFGNALRFTQWDVRCGRLPLIVATLLTDEPMRRAAREIPRPDGAAAAAHAILDLAGDRG